MFISTTSGSRLGFPVRVPAILALAIMFLTLLPALGPASTQAQTPAQGEKIKVVATFSILGDLVHNVGGDNIELITIVPPGGDAHAFDPNPEQVASIADADVIFENGAGFETWLDDMVSASGSKATRVVTSDGIAFLALDEDGHEHEAEDEHGHEAGELDPHVWHDVANAKIMVGHIRDGLIAADPANAATYNANAEAYLGQLDELDTFIRSEVAKLPEDRRKLVTSHDTFGYYAHAYGFEVVGTALSSVTTEAADPSAKQIVDLVGEIEDADVPAIFAENVSNPDLMQSIADEAGVELAPPLYTDALGEPGSDGATYIDMMRYNTTTIVTALAG